MEADDEESAAASRTWKGYACRKRDGYDAAWCVPFANILMSGFSLTIPFIYQLGCLQWVRDPRCHLVEDPQVCQGLLQDLDLLQVWEGSLPQGLVVHLQGN